MVYAGENQPCGTSGGKCTASLFCDYSSYSPTCQKSGCQSDVDCALGHQCHTPTTNRNAPSAREGDDGVEAGATPRPREGADKDKPTRRQSSWGAPVAAVLSSCQAHRQLGEACGNGHVLCAPGLGCDFSNTFGPVCKAAGVTTCCAEHGSGGCDNQIVEQCVCGIDEYCCLEAWDDVCAEMAAGECAACGGAVVQPPVAPVLVGANTCCSAGICEDQFIKGCVCAVDNFCCTIEWDNTCASMASDVCGACAAPGTPMMTTPSLPSQNNCNTPHTTGGCGDAALEACVCKFDDYCCKKAWDNQCVQKVQGCSVQATVETTQLIPPPAAPSSSCCNANSLPGCASNQGTEQCVCGVDFFCCQNAWDQSCVNIATQSCGVTCSMQG